MKDKQPSSSDDLVTKLRQLTELYEDGNLTYQEFQRAKSKLLDMSPDFVDDINLEDLLEDDVDIDEQPEEKNKDVTIPSTTTEIFFEAVFKVNKLEVDLHSKVYPIVKTAK